MSLCGSFLKNLKIIIFVNKKIIWWEKLNLKLLSVLLLKKRTFKIKLEVKVNILINR